jgi:glutathione S-transferase
MRYCPFVMRTRLVLAAKNIEYETVLINLVNKPDWYFTKNPAGRVPTLEQDEKIVIESLVTSDYLDEAYPNNPLHPSDPYLKARQRLVVESFGGEVLPLTSKVMFAATPELMKEAIESLKKGFDKLEQYEKILKDSGKLYFRGDTPGMVDYMIYPFMYRLDIGKDFVGPDAEFPKDKLPNLAAWLERMNKDPAVIKCTPNKDDLVRFMKGYIVGNKVFDP